MRDYGLLKHSLDYSDFSFELGLFCCLYAERTIFKRHYDIQNIPFYTEIKLIICTYWWTTIPKTWGNMVHYKRRTTFNFFHLLLSQTTDISK